MRELQNCLERAAILADGDTIYPKHLHLTLENFSPPPNPLSNLDFSGTLEEVTNRAVAEVERQAIRRALENAGGDTARAADQLAVGFKTLTAKIKALGI